MNIKLLTGIEIAKNKNRNMCCMATLNDLDKQEKIDGKSETHRTVYRRERDRILYSGGFRRLQDKTQVMAAVKTGDHRTRLTHSLEVEQIAISIADALRLNTDLTAAIALGHDLGHTPFGHAVERFLDKELKAEGGFSHALESVNYINKKIIDISVEIKEGILKHDTDVFVHDFGKNGQLDCEDSYYINEPPSTLEAQIVYWADKIAYITHDFEDFLKSGLLNRMLTNNQEKDSALREILKGLIKRDVEDKDFIDSKDLITDLVRNITQELISNSIYNINKYFGDEELLKYDCNDRNSKQKYIRKKTMENIEKLYNKDKEYLFLYKLQLKGEYISNISETIDNLEEFYRTEENKEYTDMLKKINRLRLQTDEKNRLEKEISEMTNLDIIKKQNEMSRYKELNSIDIDIISGRINKIKKKAYQSGLIINISDEYRKKYDELRGIIDDNYIGSPEVQLSDAKAERIVASLFDMYCSNINILPNDIKKEIDKSKDKVKEKNKKLKDQNLESEDIIFNRIKRRTIASYIASMSDRYAEQIYMDLNSTGSHYGY